MTIETYLGVTMTIGVIFAITELYRKWDMANFVDAVAYLLLCILFAPIVIPLLVGLFIPMVTMMVVVVFPMYVYDKIRNL